MSFAAQMTAIYRLFYKSSAREAFFAGGASPVQGLTEPELAALRAIPPQRLARIVELHRGDIGRGWYQPRFPAAWLALQAALDQPEDAVVAMLTEADAFELRVNDDADGRALAEFVREIDGTGMLGEAPWLRELLDYERLLNGDWRAIEGCLWVHGALALMEFTWDVGGIRSSLLEQELFPTGEEQSGSLVLFHRDGEGVSEVEVEPDVAIAVALACGVTATDNEATPPPKAHQEARALLRGLGWRPDPVRA
jgi:hypothetical protein